MNDDYWLMLLEGAHLEARTRFKRRKGQGRECVPERVQQLIDRARRARGDAPLYEKEQAA